MTIQLRRDDGALVYLNGLPIVDDQVSPDATFNDPSIGGDVDGDDESTFFEFSVDPALLINGTNLIAVEVHQHSPSSNDLSFDLRLIAKQPRVPVDLPEVPDHDAYTVDLSGRAGSTIDVVLASGKDFDFSQQTLELLDPAGTTVLATASASAAGQGMANYDLGIFGFAVPESGTYPIRLSSNVYGDYSVVVTETAVFDAEPNNRSTDTLRRLGDGDSVLGFSGLQHGSATATDSQVDTFGTGQVEAVDIASVSGIVERDTLTLTMQFYDDIPSGTQEDLLVAIFELDLDQDPSTGNPPFQQSLGAGAGQTGGPLGVELLVQVVVNLVDQSGSAFVFDPAVGTVADQPAVIVEASSIQVDVPLTMLNSDDGEINFNGLAAMQSGNAVEWTDAAPDTTFITVVPAGAGSGEAAGDLNEIDLEAGQTVRVETRTPLAGPGDENPNSLNSAIQILDASGTSRQQTPTRRLTERTP